MNLYSKITQIEINMHNYFCSKVNGKIFVDKIIFGVRPEHVKIE